MDIFGTILLAIICLGTLWILGAIPLIQDLWRAMRNGIWQLATMLNYTKSPINCGYLHKICRDEVDVYGKILSLDAKEHVTSCRKFPKIDELATIARSNKIAATSPKSTHDLGPN